MSERRITRYWTTIGYVADPIGSDSEQRVLDANRRTIGFINRRGTFDLQRRKLADIPDAGLLLNR